MKNSEIIEQVLFKPQVSNPPTSYKITDIAHRDPEDSYVSEYIDVKDFKKYKERLAKQLILRLPDSTEGMKSSFEVMMEHAEKVAVAGTSFAYSGVRPEEKKCCDECVSNHSEGIEDIKFFAYCKCHESNISQTKAIKDECCHSCSTGGKCEKQDIQPSFIDRKVNEFRIRILGRTYQKAFDPGWVAPVEDFLRTALEEAQHSRLEEMYLNGYDTGRLAERKEIEEIIEELLPRNAFFISAGKEGETWDGRIRRSALEEIQVAIRERK